MVRDLSLQSARCRRCHDADLLDGDGHCRACRGQVLYFLQVASRRAPPERILYTWGQLAAGLVAAFGAALGTLLGLYAVLHR